MDETITLREYIDIRITGVEGKITQLSEFLTQHFELNEKAIQKAEEAMQIRLDGMNEFREQIREERSNYVTREILGKVVETREIKFDIMQGRLEKLETSNAFSAGKIWMIMAIFAGIPTILALIALFVE